MLDTLPAGHDINATWLRERLEGDDALKPEPFSAEVLGISCSGTPVKGKIIQSLGLRLSKGIERDS